MEAEKNMQANPPQESVFEPQESSAHEDQHNIVLQNDKHVDESVKPEKTQASAVASPIHVQHDQSGLSSSEAHISPTLDLISMSPVKDDGNSETGSSVKDSLLEAKIPEPVETKIHEPVEPQRDVATLDVKPVEESQPPHSDLNGTNPLATLDVKPVEESQPPHSDLNGTNPSATLDVKPVEESQPPHSDLNGTNPSATLDVKPVEESQPPHSDLNGTNPSATLDVKPVEESQPPHSDLNGASVGPIDAPKCPEEKEKERDELVQPDPSEAKADDAEELADKTENVVVESDNHLSASDDVQELVAKVPNVPSDDTDHQQLPKVPSDSVSSNGIDQPIDKSSNGLTPQDDIDQPLAKVPDHYEPLDDNDQPLPKIPDNYVPSVEIDQEQPKAPNRFVSSDDTDQSLAKAPNQDLTRPLVKMSSFPIKSSPAASVHSKNPDNASAEINRVQIDTAMPIESVKHAVSKFGGIVDWKAHRVQTVERRKCIDQELEKLQEEIPMFKKQCAASEESKMQVLKELDGTRRLIEELKLNLERAQTEEQQARQDCELAKLRVEEMEQGIADEASIATKAQLEVARARHVAAVSELQSVTAELEQLKSDYAVLVAERDAAVIKAEEAVSVSKQVEKSVEDLTVELITVKQSLEAAHAAHLEAEDHRIGAAMAREQDTLHWEKEVKEAEEEIERLNKQIQSAKELRSELDTASVLLHELKAELAAYMETKVRDETAEGGELLEPEKRTHCEIQAAVASAKNKLNEVKNQVEKAVAEVNCLRSASSSLKSELEKERTELAATQQREEMASIAVASIEAELERIKSDITLARMREKEAREKMIELPKQLQQAAQEADRAKSLAETAQKELWKAKEEAEQAKAGATTIESQLLAAQKEIEAAKAAEKLAIAAMNALQESEQARANKEVESPTGVTLSLEEYYELSKQAHAAEEEANMRVAAAISQIDVAKESEFKSLRKLEDANRELSEKKKVLESAMQKAEKAREGKLAVEQELRKWREIHEQRRKTNGSVSAKSPRLSLSERKGSESFDGSPTEASSLHHRTSTGQHDENDPENPNALDSNGEAESSPDVAKTKKKKRSFFPRIFMFLARKKTSKTA